MASATNISAWRVCLFHHVGGKIGARCRVRTDDLPLTRRLLLKPAELSGRLVRTMGLEPMASTLATSRSA